MASPASRTQSKPRLAYLLAASHSGSTLLAMLLGSHPEVCTVGELKATGIGDPNEYRCSCGARIRQCAFWIDVARRMGTRGCAFDIAAAGTSIDALHSTFARRLLRPLHRGAVAELARDAALSLSPAWRRHLDHWHVLNTALVRTLCEKTASRIVVDSSKVGIRLKYLLRNPDLDVRIVRLVRDGRAVALTYTDPAEYADARRPELRGGGSGASRDGERVPMTQAAREWRRSNEEADALLARVDPASQMTVTYEELCRAPADALGRLFRFLDVSPVGLQTDWRAREYHVVGNGMRFDAASDIQLDDRWKRALPPEALAAFDLEAGAVNRRFGYV
jgi:hypothetical protein